jgi:hypothetical protein
VFTEAHLIGICQDFFEAGGETVGSTLSWVLLYLSLYQEEQKKCQNEIETEIGLRCVTLGDKINLPNCEAFIMEVQRLSCVAAAGLEHRATEDVPFHGYIIPKGDYLLPEQHDQKQFRQYPVHGSGTKIRLKLSVIRKARPHTMSVWGQSHTYVVTYVLLMTHAM